MNLKEYAKALEIYNNLEEWIRKGPSLIIEWARVYTYADKHAEAIALFEEIRRDYPEFEKDIIRERVRSGLANAKCKGRCRGQLLIFYLFIAPFFVFNSYINRL